jgi:hypothetical protein
MAPGPEQKRLRSAVSVPYNTPYSTRSGIGGGAPCFWHGGQGTRGMRNQLGKPHFGLPKRRGTTPQAFTAVRAAGTSGVSPPPGGGSHRDFHLPHANHGMATAAGCWHMLPAPRGAVRVYASGEFSVVHCWSTWLPANGRSRRLRNGGAPQSKGAARRHAPRGRYRLNRGPPKCWTPLDSTAAPRPASSYFLSSSGKSTPSSASPLPLQEHPPAATLFFTSTLRVAPGPAAPLPLAQLYIYL